MQEMERHGDGENEPFVEGLERGETPTGHRRGTFKLEIIMGLLSYKTNTQQSWINMPSDASMLSFFKNTSWH